MAPTFPDWTLTPGDLTLRPLAQSDVDDVVAARARSQWAILEHGFERVELFAATGNTGSQRAAEKAGFVREGVARNACCVHEGRMDMDMFSLVPDDLLRSRTRVGSVIEGQEQDEQGLG